MHIPKTFFKQLTIVLSTFALGWVLIAQPAEARKRYSTAAAQSITKKNVLRQSMRPGSIIVSFGDRKLYLIQSRNRIKTYPIGIPRTGFEWRGMTRVSRKTKNPRWTPTKRMRKENPDLPPYVEGGDPKNPLGVRALYLGTSQFRIHGTPASWTIGRARSAGCIRMHNSDAIDLYNRTRVGAKVLVTWKRYQANPTRWAKEPDLKKKAKPRRLTRRQRRLARKKARMAALAAKREARAARKLRGKKRSRRARAGKRRFKRSRRANSRRIRARRIRARRASSQRSAKRYSKRKRNSQRVRIAARNN